MKAIEITKKNIRNCGYYLGRTIRGKGTEIIARSNYICGTWNLDTISEEKRAKEIRELTEKIEKKGIENLFVKEVKTTKSTKLKRFDYKEYKESIEKFNIQKLIDSNFKGIRDITIYSIPKVLCIMPLTRVKSDLESQKDFIKRLMREAEQKDILFYPEDGGYEDYQLMTFYPSQNGHTNNEWEYNRDYILFHGPSTCLVPDEVYDVIDCRLTNYNDSVIGEFWNVTMAEDPFIEVDPEEKVFVYAYKGKDWYIGSGIEEDQLCITYRDDDGELVENEEFWYTADLAQYELVKKVADIVRRMHYEVEVKGLIANELKIGNYSYEGYDIETNGYFNLKILEKEYGRDLYIVYDEVLDFVDWEGIGNVDHKVRDAYERFLMHHMDKDEKLFGKYAHFVELRKIVEKEGKELVYTPVEGDINNKQWAIKYKGEEYHFYLAELFNSDPKKFYEYVSNQLTKRINERIEVNELSKKAKYVFVGLDDSVKSGNCMAGTRAFCARFGIDTNKIGGIRGDELLKLDYSPYTRRAVMQAIKREKTTKNNKGE